MKPDGSDKLCSVESQHSWPNISAERFKERIKPVKSNLWKNCRNTEDNISAAAEVQRKTVKTRFVLNKGNFQGRKKTFRRIHRELEILQPLLEFLHFHRLL